MALAWTVEVCGGGAALRTPELAEPLSTARNGGAGRSPDTAPACGESAWFTVPSLVASSAGYWAGAPDVHVVWPHGPASCSETFASAADFAEMSGGCGGASDRPACDRSEGAGGLVPCASYRPNIPNAGNSTACVTRLCRS